MTTITYTVKGMSCDNCVRAVTEEVKNVPGVSDVEIDLATGTMTLVSSSALDDTSVRAAVEEAGYEVVD